MTVLTRRMICGGLLALTVGLVLPSAAAEEAKEKPMFTDAGHSTDELATVKSRVEMKQAVLLDVREQDEWDSGHLQAARLVPLSAIKDGKVPEEFQKLLPKDRPIYLHCRSGGRVLMCAELLQGQGYDIRPLRAGYEKLVEFGFEKAAAGKTP